MIVKNSTSELTLNLDVRGDGGYVIAPPSKHHETGKPYRFVRNIPMAAAPQKLLDLVVAPWPQNGNGSGQTPTREIPKGARNDAIFHMACRLRYEGYDEETVFHLLRNVPCNPPLADAEIRKQIHGAFQYNGRRAAESAGRTAACEAVLACINNIPRVELEWLWRKRFPLGKLAVIAGDGGLGKSVLTLDFAARVSRGRDWPNGDPCKKGSVIILSAEDDAGDTIRPRLEAAGADLTKIHILKAVRVERPNGDNALKYFSFATDMTALEQAVHSIGDVVLIIVDPISAYLGTTIDARKNAEVRSVLHPLVELAAPSHAMVLAITHLNKGMGPALYRIMDSVAFAAAGRTAWLVSKNRENPTERLLLPGKSNLGPDDASLGFTFTLKEKSGAVVVEWGIATSVTADAALETDIESASEKSARDEAMQWLTSVLEAGAQPVTVIQEQAKSDGFSWATVRRAKSKLPIHSHKLSMAGGWAWELTRREGVQ